MGMSRGANRLPSEVWSRPCGQTGTVGTADFPAQPATQGSACAWTGAGEPRTAIVSSKASLCSSFASGSPKREDVRAAAKLTVGFLVLAASSGVSISTTSASAKPPPSYRRGQISHFVQDMFDRFFFKAWLKEPISLSGQGACTEAQIREALQHKEKFPKAFRRRAKGPGLSAEYCAAVSIQLNSSCFA